MKMMKKIINDPRLNVDEQQDDKNLKLNQTLMIQMKFKKSQLPEPP